MDYCSRCKHKNTEACKLGEPGCYSPKVSITDILDSLDAMEELAMDFGNKCNELRLIVESYIDDHKGDD